MGECQAVIAEAVSRFGKVDVLVCCTSQGQFSNDFQYYGSLALTSLGSRHWDRGRACCISTDIEPRARPVRNQLLRPCKFHKSSTASNAETASWPHISSFRH